MRAVMKWILQISFLSTSFCWLAVGGVRADSGRQPEDINVSPSTGTASAARTGGSSCSHAEKAFAAGKWLEAAGGFENCIDSHPDGDRLPDLYYNIGLAWDAAGRKDRALAGFLHAWTLDPRRNDVATRLQALAPEAEDSNDWGTPWWLPDSNWLDRAAALLRMLVSEAGWFWGTALATALFLFWGACRFLSDSRWVARLHVGTGVIVAVLVAAMATLQATALRGWGAVAADHTPVNSSPSELGTVMTTLSVSSPVGIEAIEGEWLRVRLHDHQSGWVPRNMVATYMASASKP